MQKVYMKFIKFTQLRRIDVIRHYNNSLVKAVTKAATKGAFWELQQSQK